MMQNLFKITTLIVVLFVAVAVSSCRTPDNNAEDDNNVYNESFEPAPLPEPMRDERKTYSREDAKTEFEGEEEHLYANFKYPSYWSLKKSPGMKEIPGVDKVERWCKFRLESLDASIEITVLDGVRDLDEMIPQIKKQILNRYSLKSFLESPPRLVEIDGVKAEGDDDKDGKLKKVDRIDSDDEESLPKYKYTETESKPQTTTDLKDKDTEAKSFRSNFELNMLLDDDDDDDLNLDDDDDDDMDDDLNLDDDDDDETDDDDLNLDDDDDDDTDDDDDLNLDDDDDETDDDDEAEMDDDDDDDEVVESDTTEKSNGSKIFKRNEVWRQGDEMWVKTNSLYIEKHKIKVLEYEGRFVYDQKLYLVKVYAVNRIADDKTYYSIFVCEAENFVRYETEYTETVQSVKFKAPKAE